MPHLRKREVLHPMCPDLLYINNNLELQIGNYGKLNQFHFHQLETYRTNFLMLKLAFLDVAFLAFFNLLRASVALI